ncbi:MAG TPA: protein-methionine-sulfoxide reductase catalytic subunit MsrP [Armatimonadota bacterium]|jgi:sulfoxide reductase catalytic subunit YedY
MEDRSEPPSSEITPENTYLNRRAFLKAGVLAASVLATGTLYRRLNTPSSAPVNAKEINVVAPIGPPESGFHVDEPRTSFQDITHYNNFYEFSTNKDAVADAAADFMTSSWKVEVGGLVNKPKVFDLDDILKIAQAEERVYRMRCVEGWSMVIPWAGYSLSKLLKRVDPLGSAKYVAMQTLLDPRRMPGQNTSVLQWPYVEGLRMDEAMHPLAILASGIYGHALPPQDGAPLRLVVPWKYGFKGIKSIVKIMLVETQPATTWNIAAPSEYGFYANVNPNVDHPRWSQATEQRIGESGRRRTLMFNGYERQVGSLYTGMDLRKNF